LYIYLLELATQKLKKKFAKTLPIYALAATR